MQLDYKICAASQMRDIWVCLFYRPFFCFTREVSSLLLPGVSTLYPHTSSKRCRREWSAMRAQRRGLVGALVNKDVNVNTPSECTRMMQPSSLKCICNSYFLCDNTVRLDVCDSWLSLIAYNHVSALLHPHSISNLQLRLSSLGARTASGEKLIHALNKSREKSFLCMLRKRTARSQRGRTCERL